LLLWVALLIAPSLGAITRVDDAALRAVAHLRTGAITSLMRAANHLGSSSVTAAGACATIAALLTWRRFQHLVVYLVALLATSFVVLIADAQVARMRPAGITILDHWQGYANPSQPVSALAVVLAGAVFTLAPAGVWRRRAGWVAAALLAVLCAARLYLAVDHPTDVFAALAVGWALPALLFRLGTPDEAFPITYRWGARAHLDIGTTREDAIRRALLQQLGAQLVSIEPFGLGGSAGSTPLRLEIRQGDAACPKTVFAKLYALGHLRSDRLYKLVRSIRYGRLEDERPFSTVRRLVEYEDHLLRLFRDLGLPTPQPYGFVEITPEREYLIAMEFFDGAQELSGTITDAEIDQGVAIVRTMWDAGVAHRDIKPSNLLLAGRRVLLIDVAFGAVRPSPWRQAVDLANMMLTLALASSAERVYGRALLLFTPDDVAEAFAASGGVTIPSQLRSRLRADGRDLPAQFRLLAPPRPPLPVQRWTLNRLLTTFGAVSGIALIVWGSLIFARAAGLL
ncbi:MAG TPA: lipopolysaccharide kinase InaA family protein, partial [Acidimicrobiales bacterium]|nr:lipopolysaccharide kinase InaA family protein [Acidimicrobiales bacterium]